MGLSEDFRTRRPASRPSVAPKSVPRQPPSEDFFTTFIEKECVDLMREIEQRFRDGQVTGEWAISICARLCEQQRLSRKYEATLKAARAATASALGDA